MSHTKNRELTPAEYAYIASPIQVQPTDLIKLTLQDLCLKGLISIESRWVEVDKSYRKKRLRYYIIIQPSLGQYTSRLKHEEFFLKHFHFKGELSFTNLLYQMKQEFKVGGTMSFQKKYLLKDLREEKLLFLGWWPNFKAAKRKKQIQQLLQKVKWALQGDKFDLLEQLLPQLGNHILHLEKEELEKLSYNSSSIQSLASIPFIQLLSQQFTQFDEFFYGAVVGGFSFSSVSFESGSSFSGGDFGGFGGGDFGGGGAFGDW